MTGVRTSSWTEERLDMVAHCIARGLGPTETVVRVNSLDGARIHVKTLASKMQEMRTTMAAELAKEDRPTIDFWAPITVPAPVTRAVRAASVQPAFVEQRVPRERRRVDYSTGFSMLRGVGA